MGHGHVSPAPLAGRSTEPHPNAFLQARAGVIYLKPLLSKRTVFDTSGDYVLHYV